VYENALVHRLRKAGLDVKQQHPLKVYDEDGTEIGDYYADLIVEDVLIIELKACKTFAEEHKAQIIGYLRSANIEHGLLINFGSFKFQIQKFVLDKTNRSSIVPKALSILFSFASFALFRG
jgi:GxxExxY protein